MKNITLLLVLFTFGLQAQTFPSPYCDIDPTGTTVEEITAVDFAGSSITNTDASSILIDETATVTNVTPGDTYTLLVEGDTKGNFDTDIVAFIDWNQNAVLDDANEVYEIGTLTNSTGSDGVSVSMDITVPSDALSGTTRIRITKTYTDEVGEGGAPPSPAIINPCAIVFDAFGQGASPGFGQALGFTLNIGTLGTETFDATALSAYPNPTQGILNVTYKSELNAVTIYNLLGQEIYTQNTESSDLQLNVSTLTAGVYFIKLVTEEAQYTFRILKQ